MGTLDYQSSSFSLWLMLDVSVAHPAETSRTYMQWYKTTEPRAKNWADLVLSPEPSIAQPNQIWYNIGPSIQAILHRALRLCREGILSINPALCQVNGPVQTPKTPG